MNTKLQHKNNTIPKKRNAKRSQSVASIGLRYKFWILIGDLILAGIAIILRIDTPVGWTFLYGIGGWAALTTNPGSNLR